MPPLQMSAVSKELARERYDPVLPYLIGVSHLRRKP
jgi:hypothetical protein